MKMSISNQTNVHLYWPRKFLLFDDETNFGQRIEYFAAVAIGVSAGSFQRDKRCLK